MLFFIALSIISAPDQVPPLKLIPTPQSVQRLDGAYHFTAKDAIVIANPKDSDDSFAGQQLADEIKQDFKLNVAVGGKGKGVLIGVIGRDAAISKALGAIKLAVTPKDGQYLLAVRKDRIIIAGVDSEAVFDGVQTLKQLIRANATGTTIPCCTIVDWPALKMRGWQDDISRGPITTMDYLKREIRTLSEYKYNFFTMYTEHVFKLKKHPAIAPPDGITAKEVHELSEYGKKYHVQIVGNFQSFGHFANILSVKGYENLAETGWVISPAKEESYKFLDDVYSEIAPAYDSPLFNINCDETWGLGEGASKQMVKEMGLGGVYAYHINRIADLLKKYGKTPLMWGDIALQHREIVAKLPKDLIVLSWGYDPLDSFDDWIKPFKEIGFRFIVCPCVGCFGQLYPDFDDAIVNISNFTRDGAMNGALGMLNTTWDDSGENFFGYNWYPLLWGAECSWKPAIPAAGQDKNAVREQRHARFVKCFDPIFFGVPGDKNIKGLITVARMRKDPACGGGGDAAFWIDLPRAVEKQSQPIDISEYLNSFTAAIGPISTPKHNVDCIDEANFAAMRYFYIAMRTSIASLISGRNIADELKSVDSLKKQVRQLRIDYAKLWKAENRPWWLDRNMAKYDRLIAQLNAFPDRPLFSPGARFIPSSQDVTLYTLNGKPIHYTTDGTEPTENSPLYAEPIQITKTTQIKARVLPSGEVATASYLALRLPAKVTTTLPIYQDHVPEIAFDGNIDTYYWSYGQALAGATFTVILNTPAAFQHIKVTTGHPDHSEDTVHEGVLEIFDGTAYTKIADFKDGIAEAELARKTISGVRIRLTKDNNNWLVVREIELR